MAELVTEGSRRRDRYRYNSSGYRSRRARLEGDQFHRRRIDLGDDGIDFTWKVWRDKTPYRLRVRNTSKYGAILKDPRPKFRSKNRRPCRRALETWSRADRLCDRDEGRARIQPLYQDSMSAFEFSQLVTDCLGPPQLAVRSF